MRGIRRKIISFFSLNVGIVFSLIFGYFHTFIFAQNQQTSHNILQIEQQANENAKMWDEKTLRESLRLFLQSAELWKAEKKLSNSARCLREAAKLKLIIGEEKSALDLLNQSLILEEKSQNLEGKIETLILISTTFLKLNDFAKSGFFNKKALLEAQKINQPKLFAKIYFLSGTLAFNNQNFQEMKDYLEKSLQIFREVEDKNSEIEVLIELAFCYTINNDRNQAINLAQTAFDLAKENNNIRMQTFALIAKGDAYQKMGDWSEAIKAFNEAKKNYPDNVDLYEKAILTNRIGFYYLAYNELNQAQFFFQEALVIFNKLNREVGSSELLSILGEIAISQKKYNEAHNFFEQSRQIAEKTNNPISLGMLNLKIGETLYELGEFQKARTYFLYSINNYKTIGINFRTAEVQEKLGLTYEKEQNFEEAKNKYVSALNLNLKVINKVGQAENHYNLAHLYNDINKPQSAFESISESIKVTESVQAETVNNILKNSYLSDVYKRYELYIYLLMQKQKESFAENFTLQALQATEKLRSRSLLETLRLSDANFTKDADPGLVKREKEILNLLNTKTNKLTELLSNQAEKTEIEKIEDEIRNLNNELEEIRAKFKQDSPIYSAIKNPPPFDVAEFQQNVLDDKTLLLEFSLGEKESYLWLVGKNEVSSFVLPTRNFIESRIDTILKTFEGRQIQPNEEIETYQKRLSDLENTFNQEAKILSNDLLGQIADKIKDKRLIIVPDGKLHYLPLSALPFPNSDEPLILRNEIVYEPSASLLNLFPKLQKRNKQPSKDLLVFADPVFSDNDSRLLAKSEDQNSLPTILGLNLRDFRLMDANGKIPRLLASQEEANEITDVVGKSRSTIVTGFEANRDSVLKPEIADYKVLHFATHGLVDIERPEVSSIVLSQFNENGQKQEGFLRLQDIYTMDLASDLVVLSACQSGVGKEIKGEGLMSLNNAFLQAGAKSALSSAWKVDDNATAELMKNFYINLKDKGLTPSESLRQAQIKMFQSTQFKSPFYWAAFNVQGEFSQPVRFSTNYFYYYLLAGLLVLIIFLYLAFRIFKAQLIIK